MIVQKIKQLDKNSALYKRLKWWYLHVLFYFINVDTFGKPKFIRRMVGGQHVDIEQVEGFISPTDGVVIDVGAERGEMARHFAGLGYTVYAIEPERKNNLYIRLHTIFLRLFGKLKVYRLACGESDGEAVLNVSDLSFRHSVQSQEYGNGEQQKVRQVNLGNFVNKKRIPKIALLKIDAEGFDLPILKGFLNTTKVFPKAIMFEADPGSIHELLALVKSRGYNYFRFICRLDEQPNVGYQKRLAIYDGIDPEVFTMGSNVICLQKEFRILNPLVNNR